MEILFLNLWGRIANGILAYQTIDQIFEVDFRKNSTWNPEPNWKLGRAGIINNERTQTNNETRVPMSRDLSWILFDFLPWYSALDASQLMSSPDIRPEQDGRKAEQQEMQIFLFFIDCPAYALMRFLLKQKFIALKRKKKWKCEEWINVLKGAGFFFYILFSWLDQIESISRFTFPCCLFDFLVGDISFSFRRGRSFYLLFIFPVYFTSFPFVISNVNTHFWDCTVHSWQHNPFEIDFS